MDISIRRRTALAALAFMAGSVWAQFPDRPIKLIVPFAPGGPVDRTARLVATPLQQRLGQPVIVENRPGAGGAIGVESVARAAADGYTILVAPSSMTAHAALNKVPRYDARKDFAHLTLAIRSPYLIVVNPGVPVKTLAELIAYAKANPGKLNYGSPGAGSGNHLAAELFKSITKTHMVHIPYRGAGPALQALVAGDIQVSFDPVTGARPLMEAGKIRALALTTGQRFSLMPNVPAAVETVPGYETSFWVGFSAPAGTPKDVAAKLSSEIIAIVRSPEFRQQLLASAAEPVGNTAEEYTRYIDAEVTRWGKVVKEAGIETLN